MSEQRLLQTGTANSTPIMVDVLYLSPAVPVKVTLTADYAATRPPGYPSRPSLTGVDAADLDIAKTIPSGTILTLLKPEADALVGAGAASYA